MSAPNSPVSTVKPRSRSSLTIFSMTGSATSPGAASDHEGRRPFWVRPISVNWLTTSTEPLTSEMDLSRRPPHGSDGSGNNRNSAILRTMVSHASSASSRPLPINANTAGPSTYPETRSVPSGLRTMTLAWLTVLKTAFKGAFLLSVSSFKPTILANLCSCLSRIPLDLRAERCRGGSDQR